MLKKEHEERRQMEERLAKEKLEEELKKLQFAADERYRELEMLKNTKIR